MLPRVLNQFLRRRQLDNQPLLLALSGGADSLALFYSLLLCQKELSFSFHIAHVDHGWRSESASEAATLKALASSYQIPFHEKKLDPRQLKGNLENACREQRLFFFAELCQKYQLQGVLLGHHQDDQAETVLKRLLEGAHWSHFSGLKEDLIVNGIRVLRPFLSLSKKEINHWLQQQGKDFFEDPTNEDSRFLRARMRKTILPILSQTFEKDVRSSLVHISQEMTELRDYFDKRVTPLLEQIQQGPLGYYLNTQDFVLDPLEVKYLFRRFCEKIGCSLSRQQVELAQKWIVTVAADRLLEGGKYQIWIDRRKIFMIPSLKKQGEWKGEWRERNYHPSLINFSWQTGWSQGFKAYLPLGDYHLAPASMHLSYHHVSSSIGKWWTDHKIPAFLSRSVPVLWQGSTIYHEFLTGKNLFPFQLNDKCLEYHLYYQT